MVKIMTRTGGRFGAAVPHLPEYLASPPATTITTIVAYAGVRVRSATPVHRRPPLFTQLHFPLPKLWSIEEGLGKPQSFRGVVGVNPVPVSTNEPGGRSTACEPAGMLTRHDMMIKGTDRFQGFGNGTEYHPANTTRPHLRISAEV